MLPIDLATPVMPFRLATEWLAKLYGEFKEVRARRKQEIDVIADVFGEPTELVQFYVQPDCQQFNPADDGDDELSYVVREPLFRRLEAFLGGPRREGKHQLFILSDAGMGKTSALVMLKLAHLSRFWPPEYDCLLLKLGPDSLSVLKQLPQKANTVVLLDALDEDPSAWGRIRERIGELLNETYHFRRTIITCRTQFFSADEDPFTRRGQVEVEGFLCPVIFNSLLSEDQTQSYLEKRFGGRKESKKLIEKSKDIVQKMGSLKFRPMLLAHIEDLIEAEGCSWNEYTVYEALVRSWLLREQRKRLDRKQSMTPLNQLWAACQLLAQHLQQTGEREVSETKLRALILDFPFLAQIPEMDITGRSLLNKNSAGNYRFSHYSIQEFLVVHGALLEPSSFDLPRQKVTGQMSAFVAAWLADPTRKAENPRAIRAFPLAGSYLAKARLDGLDLRNMDLRGANLSYASLIGAQLQWADLSSCDLRGANLSGAKLHYAKFDQAVYDTATRWPISGVPNGATVFSD